MAGFNHELTDFERAAICHLAEKIGVRALSEASGLDRYTIELVRLGGRPRRNTVKAIRAWVAALEVPAEKVDAVTHEEKQVTASVRTERGNGSSTS